MQERLIKARLILLSNDKDITFIVEYALCLAPFGAVSVAVHVHGTFGVLRAVGLIRVFKTSAERNHNLDIVIIVLFQINGTLYEGTGMSGYKVRNGITIYVRFTLSYGKDIGGYDSTGGGYGSLSSYCGLWINGGYQALGHDFVETDRLEPTETEDGYIHYRCSKCHEEKTDILLATGGTEPSPTAAQAAPALLLRRGSGLTPYQNKFHRTWEAAA